MLRCICKLFNKGFQQLYFLKRAIGKDVAVLSALKINLFLIGTKGGLRRKISEFNDFTLIKFLYFLNCSTPKTED